MANPLFNTIRRCLPLQPSYAARKLLSRKGEYFNGPCFKFISETGYGGIKDDGVMAVMEKSLTETIELLDQKSDYEEVKGRLEEMKRFVTSVNPYAIDRSTPLSPQIDKIMEETSTTLSLTNLFEEGKLLRNLNNTDLHMISFPGQGYSICGMAEVMHPGGKVTGIEIEPVFCDLVRQRARDYNLNVEVRQGKAIDILKSLAEEGQQYDLIYVDCIKREYLEYYKIIMDNKMLSSNGLIVCDNVLWSGQSITRSTESGAALDDFTLAVAQDERVISVMLPCHDGTLLIQHRHDKRIL